MKKLELKKLIKEIISEQDFGSPLDASPNNTNAVLPVVSDSSGARVHITCPSGYAFMKNDGTLALGNMATNDPWTSYGSSSNNPSRYVVLTKCYPIQKTNPPSPTSPRPPMRPNSTNPRK